MRGEIVTIGTALRTLIRSISNMPIVSNFYSTNFGAILEKYNRHRLCVE